MSDVEPPKKPSASEKQPQEEELRQTVREDIAHQREFIEKLRRKVN